MYTRLGQDAGADATAQTVQTAENGPAIPAPSMISSLLSNKWVMIAGAALAVGWYTGYINPKKFGF